MLLVNQNGEKSKGEPETLVKGRLMRIPTKDTTVSI